MRTTARWTTFAVVALSLVIALASVGSAGERDHEDGLFLRLSVGGGTASSETSVADLYRGGGRSTALKFDGMAVDLNFAIGAMIRPNLALHGTLLGWAIADPELTIGSESGTASADLYLSALAGGVTYYFMPANAYVSTSVGFGSLTVEDDNVSVESDNGLVLDLTVGKEWWVNEKWGLGVAGGAIYHSIPDESAEEDWSGWSYALRFTATMN